MTHAWQPFAQCSLSDLAYEIYLFTRAASSSNIDATAADLLLPSLFDVATNYTVVQQPPLDVVRGSSGLLCTGTAGSEHACSMLRDVFDAAGAAVSDAVLLRIYEYSRRGRVRLCAFIARLFAHPALPLADHELVAELMAHPVYCLASQISARHLGDRVVFCCRAASLAQHWHATGIDIGLMQRRTLLGRGALCSTLMLRLLCFRGKCRVKRPLLLANRIMSRRHFLGSKQHQTERLFKQGQRLYGQQRYSEAAKSWGQAALLQHAPSHAFLSSLLFEGKGDVAKDEQRAFEFASGGAALGCAHSKGALSRCYYTGAGVAEDKSKALALGRESAAAGSCFGQHVVGWCYMNGLCVAKDDAEAVRLFHLAAAQGYAAAQMDLGKMFANGQGVAKDDAEAVRLYRLAAAQGNADAILLLRFMSLVSRCLV